jgi:EpsI family protein
VIKFEAQLIKQLLMDHSKRFAIAAAGMMVTAAASALLKPEPKKLQSVDHFDLQFAVPKNFGSWSYETLINSSMVDPKSKELLDKIYSQILARTYKNAAGYRMMLSIAYGSDQRGALQAHKPEVCYPAQGFSMIAESDAEIKVPNGVIPVRQLQMVMGPRREPVTYWFTVGDQAIQSAFEQRLAMLKSTMTGRIPDGLLFRVSSIDRESKAAFLKQSLFVAELLSASTPTARTKLSGLPA